MLVDGDILLVQTPLVKCMCVQISVWRMMNVCVIFHFVRLLGGILKHCGLYVFSFFARGVVQISQCVCYG